jgi:prepilin-type N-terminal cleavage/methylation domain-containing protein
MNNRFYPVGNRRLSFRAFTVIELLVVIAIIGVLASIILVTLSGVRVKARDVKRLAELRSMRMAIELYISQTGKVPGSSQQCFRSSSSTEWSTLATALGVQSLPVDPLNGTGDYKYVFFRSNYGPGGCNVAPECGWLMAKRENDNYLMIISFFKGGYTMDTVACSWTNGCWNPNCGGQSYSGYVAF